jgi:DNA-binding transcriptional LysR family regulator
MTSVAQLRHLMVLAETGSFTRSAALCNRSQAAFSRSIAALEGDLGIALVNRIGHNNDLTPAGRAVLEQARHVLAEVDELDRVVKFQTDGGLGQVKVGLGSTPHALLSYPLLTHAAQHHGTMRIKISQAPVDQLLTALRERKLDLLVVDSRSILPATDLCIDPLAELQTGLLCRHGHPLVEQPSVTFSDLTKYPMACTPMSEEMARQVVETYGVKAHPDAFISLCSDDILSLLAVVRETNVIFLGIAALGQKWVAEGKLARLPFLTTGFTSRFAVVQLNGRTVLPALKLIRELMNNAVRGIDTQLP